MYRWAIFAVLASIYFLVYFHRTSSAVLADILMDEFGVTALAIGVLSSAYFYPYALLQIPVGALSDTKGPRKTTTFFTLIAFLGSLLFGLANSFYLAVIARFFIGIGVSGVYIPTIKVLSRWFKKQEFATLTGTLFAIGNFGAMVSAYPLAMMVIIFGWRESFLIIGLITLLLAFLCWIIVRDSPQAVGLEPIEGDDVGKVKIASDVTAVLRNKYFWLLAIPAFLRYGATMGFQGLWGGPYLSDVYHLPKDAVGSVLVAVGLGTVVGAPTIGFLSDRVFKRRKLFLVLGSLGFTATWFPLAFATSDLNYATLYAISFAMGFFGGAGSITYAVTKELFPLRMTGLATSMVNVFPFFGSAVFQMVMGYIMDLVGKANGCYPVEAYTMAFQFCFVAALLSVICSVFIKETLAESA